MIVATHTPRTTMAAIHLPSGMFGDSYGSFLHLFAEGAHEGRMALEMDIHVPTSSAPVWVAVWVKFPAGVCVSGAVEKRVSDPIVRETCTRAYVAACFAAKGGRTAVLDWGDDEAATAVMYSRRTP